MKKFIVGLATIGKVVMRPFFPVKVIGPKKIENKKSLLVANHVSGWDPIIFTMSTKGFHSFVYKAEFENNRFLRWVFHGLDCVPVHRGDVDMAATRQILRLLKEDKSVAIFPEGTRNPNVDCLQPFHTGPALFALKTHAPIRPYYIWDKSKAFRRNYIIIGDEFALEELYDRPITKELLEQATEIIKQHVDALRVQLNEILAEKGVKRRKRTKKEIERTHSYNAKQKTLYKRESQAEAKSSAEDVERIDNNP